MPDSKLFGKDIKRLEDPVLLRGQAHFVDDIRLPEMVHACFVRSPFAHAVVNGIDISEAAAVEGVIAVLTIEDLRPQLISELLVVGLPSPSYRQESDRPVLASTEVAYVGEPVAVVIAASRHIAEDAAAMVQVDYDPLPAVNDCKEALEEGGPTARVGAPHNLMAEFLQEYGDVETAFANAPHVFKESLLVHRGGSHSIECRGCVARYEEISDELTIWTSHQMPHSLMRTFVEITGLDENKVRVVTPHIGGGFGPKLVVYQEDVTLLLASKIVKRPIKWIEDRREHLLTTTQERDQIWEVELAADAEGKLLGLRGRLYHDQGAYTVRGTNIPFSAATTILGPYILPSYRMDVSVAHTNKVPATSMRGAGHPQGNFTMERLIDRMADKIGMDPAEIRARNLIPAERIPYEQPLKTQAGQRIIYDSGDYPKCQSDLLDALDYAGFPARQAAARGDGRYLGLAVANYVKPTGRGPFESGLVRIGTSGKVSVYTGAVAMGQGFRTAMAQLCSEQLGVRPEDVIIVAGDTDTVSHGIGGFASRQTVCAGSAIHMASGEVRKKVLSVAAHLLEASEEDLDLKDGNVFVKGVPDMAVGFREVANAVAGIPGVSLPDGISAGLEAEVNFKPENVTYANGAHGCEVEVDPETGGVKILRYVVIHDSGRLVNPLIVDGQVQGGVTLGIGHALFEQMMYDESGQPLSTNLAEYLIPTAPEVPNYEIVHQVSPTDRNPIGVKGVGECGVMAAMPALLAAVENALTDFSVKLDRYPVTPAMIAEKVLAGSR